MARRPKRRWKGRRRRRRWRLAGRGRGEKRAGYGLLSRRRGRAHPRGGALFIFGARRRRRWRRVARPRKQRRWWNPPAEARKSLLPQAHPTPRPRAWVDPVYGAEGPRAPLDRTGGPWCAGCSEREEGVGGAAAHAPHAGGVPATQPGASQPRTEERGGAVHGGTHAGERRCFFCSAHFFLLRRDS